MQDLHQLWPHRWLSPKAKPRQSNIQGIGVFAKEKILKGEKVGVLGGIIVSKAHIREYRKIMTQVGIQIDDNFFIVPATREELEKYGVFNHCCEPNIGFSNSITYIAIRDVKKGEELVFDYAFCETYFDGFNCNCGSKFCRHHITKDDWKNKDIQKKYYNYFSPYLKSKIKL